MFENVSLFITDVAYVFFFFVTTLFGLWIYLKSSRSTSHVTFLLMSFAIGLYQISHVIGINTPDPEGSRLIFQLSLSLIFVIAFTVHWIAATIERQKEHAKSIAAFYAVGVALVLFFLAYPKGFLLESASKLYFPNYYQAGSFYWLFVAYFIVGFFYVMRLLVRSYRMADELHRNRLSYYIAAILIGFPLGASSFLLAYNIQFDPLYSIGFNFYIIPLAYGVLRYDIMNIKLAARKTLGYAVVVLGTALFIIATNAGDEFLRATVPGAPDWAVPLGSALVIVLFAGYMWERVRDLESLKYEFITVVTHKFRTPLTRIKWAAEMMKHHIDPEKNEEEQLALGEIEDADEHLVALTDMLVGLRKADQSLYLYAFEALDLCDLVNKAVRNMKKHLADKKIDLVLDCPAKQIFASVDKRRMLFALQIIIENAVTYTPSGGKIVIKATSDGSDARIAVTDSGIGIAKEDLSRIFSKFWRSKEAKAADTEGMGIGLFMAKEIAEHHDGEITAESEGLGKGATFTIRLPIVKE